MSVKDTDVNLFVGLVLKNSFNATVIEGHLDVKKGERFACISS